MTEFEYKGFHDCESVCGIDIYPINEHVVFIATELVHNKGTSITNAFETLCPSAVKHFGYSLDNVVWIEHYPMNSLPDAGEEGDSDTWAFVATQLKKDGKIDPSKTSFENLTQEDVDEIIEGDFQFGLAELVVIRDD